MTELRERTAGVAEARALIEAGRERFPLAVSCGDDELHRLWAAALYCRTLDGYDAALRLHEARLDSDARAALRIAFDHLTAFTWLVANPEDAERPRRIAQAGNRFNETRAAELTDPSSSMRSVLSSPDDRPDPSARLPSTRQLCQELDDELPSRVGALRIQGSLFSRWYSKDYRGASMFVHPNPVGLHPLIVENGRGREVRPWRTAPDGFGQVLTAQLRATAEIAREMAPWLTVA